jgi:hypothetical protein
MSGYFTPESLNLGSLARIWAILEENLTRFRVFCGFETKYLCRDHRLISELSGHASPDEKAERVKPRISHIWH